MKFYIALVALCLVAVTQARYYKRQAGQQQGSGGGGGGGDGSHAPKWAKLVVDNVRFLNCFLEHDDYETAKGALLAEVKAEAERESFKKGMEEFEGHVDKLHKIKENMDKLLEDSENEALSADQLKKLEEDMKAKKDEKKKIRGSLIKLFEHVTEEDMKNIHDHFGSYSDMVSECSVGHSAESQESQESQSAQGDAPAKREYKELLNVLKALVNKRK